MSSRKVKPFKRTLNIVSAVYSSITGLVTFVTNTHYLTNGNLITVSFPDVPQILLDVPVTFVSSTSFTIPTPMDYRLSPSTEIEIKYYSTGQTGGQESLTLASSTTLPAVIQSWVSGTGTAVYTVEASLDNLHWTTDGVSITHTAADGNTQAVTISVSWAYVRINITSIGASTKLYVNLGA
jgi:hypothetical protein